MSPRFAVTLNALALYAIGLVLLGASYFQISLGELPCPLCILQRVAFVGLAAGSPVAPALGLFEKGAIWLMLAMTVLNAASALLECGFGACPAAPVRYELIAGSA